MLNAGFQTIDQLKPLVLPEEYHEETSWDADLRAIGAGVAAAFGRFCNREFDREASSVYSSTADCESVSLPRYPVESVSAVTLTRGIGVNAESETITDLVENVGYTGGVVLFYSVVGLYTERVNITYTGGYWLDPGDGSSLPSGATALPADVLSAYHLQVQAQVEHTNKLRSGAVRSEEKESRSPMIADLDLLPQVKTILTPYRRIA